MVSKTSRQELAIQRAKKYLRSQGIMNKRDEDKMSDKVRKKMEEILRKVKGGAASRREAYQEATKKAAGKRITSSNVKKAEKALKKRRMQQKAKEAGLFITGKAEGGLPKSRLINPYVSVRKSKEFTKNEKAAAEIKREGATIGARIKNLNVGVTYDKDKYTKPRFTQKMTKKGVNIGVGGRKGNLNISAGKKTESNPFEGKKTGKYYEIQGTVNFSKGGRAAIRGTKFTGVK